jgi:hypothetical protein
MNISHTNENELHLDDEVAYATSWQSTKLNNENAVPEELNLKKIFELLDNATPNYVLGYN